MIKRTKKRRGGGTDSDRGTRKRSRSHSHSKSSSPSERKRARIHPKSVWKTRVPSKDQILCKKYYPKNPEELANVCYKYNDNLWIKNKYGMKKITDNAEASPLFIFKQGEHYDYAAIKDGVHNFMLFWDNTMDEQKQTYTLVTAFFNPFEFGNKHNIISLRTAGQTPDTFIISGEIKKDGNHIKFHDTSSQYFQDNPCNIKRQMPVIYLYDLIEQNQWDIKNITPGQLDELKTTLFAHNEYDDLYKRNIMKTKNITDLIELLKKYFPLGEEEKSVIYSNYIDLIQSIIADAFKLIFTDAPASAIDVTYVKKFTPAEYNEHGQQNVKKFTKEMCHLSKPLPFDVYFDAENCENDSNKSRYNSCQIDEITDDYMRETMHAKTPPAALPPSIPTMVKITTAESVILLSEIDLTRNYGWFISPNLPRLNDKLIKAYPPPATITFIKENFAVKYHDSIDAAGNYMK